MKKKKITQEEILELIRQGYTQTEIAKKNDVSPVAISNRVKKMNIQEVEKAKDEGKNKRKAAQREEILELIRQGYTQSEIAEMKSVSAVAISNRIKKMNIQEVEKAKDEGKNKRKAAQREEILELIRQGYTQSEIAEMKSVSAVAISNKVKKINKQEVERARKEGKKKKKEIRILQQKEILEPNRQGYTQTQIAKKIGISQHTVSVWINEIPKQEFIEGKRRTEIMEKIQQRKLTKEDVEKYREELQSMGNKVGLEDIEVLLKAYIKINKLEKAIEFIKDIIKNREIEQSDIEKLEQIKRKLGTTKRVQTARNELKQGKSISQVMSITGFDKAQIKKIKSEMEKSLEKEL